MYPFKTGKPEMDKFIQHLQSLYKNNNNSKIMGFDNFSPDKSKHLSRYKNEVERELTSSVFIPLAVFFFLVIIISLIGNSLVCLVIYRKRSMRTVVNIFLLNLSIIQILICVLIIPTNLIKFVHRTRWVLGTPMCYIVFFVQCLTMYQSSFILISIALDRYRVIVVPLRKRISHRTAYIMLGVSWSVAAVISSFQLLAVRTDSVSLDIVTSVMWRNSTTQWCSQKYPPALSGYLYGLVFVTQYCIPLFVMVTLYTRIVIVLRSCVERGASISGQIRNRSKRKVVTMLIVVVVLFFISWAPVHIYLILTSVKAKFNFTVYYACYWFAMSNVWYNPIIYCWLNVRYRRAVRLVLGGCFRWNPSSSTQKVVQRVPMPHHAVELRDYVTPKLNMSTTENRRLAALQVKMPIETKGEQHKADHVFKFSKKKNDRPYNSLIYKVEQHQDPIHRDVVSLP